MRIGIPAEIKIHEYRVGLMPAAVRDLTLAGHTVVVQSRAGEGVGCSDEDYRAAGARILADAAAVFAGGELIVKVKEPQLDECALLRRGQVLFTYLHLAADPGPGRGTDEAPVQPPSPTRPSPTTHGALPLLAPMSEVAGRMSVQVGAHCLEKRAGRRAACCSAACRACRPAGWW